MPSNGKRSTILWADVPRKQRDTVASIKKSLRFWSQPTGDRDVARMSDMMRPWLRAKLDLFARIKRSEPHCPMATQQTYDKARKVWVYSPCANRPRDGQRFCWRHQSDS